VQVDTRQLLLSAVSANGNTLSNAGSIRLLVSGLREGRGDL
jgi:hypothetical protein